MDFPKIKKKRDPEAIARKILRLSMGLGDEEGKQRRNNQAHDLVYGLSNTERKQVNQHCERMLKEREGLFKGLVECFQQDLGRVVLGTDEPSTPHRQRLAEGSSSRRTYSWGQRIDD
jgi:hypothetical protein